MKTSSLLSVFCAIVFAMPAFAETEEEALNRLGAQWDLNLGLEGLDLKSITARNQGWDVELEIGDLGPSRGDSVLGSSPYLSVEKGRIRSNRFIDYEIRGKLGVIDLDAHYGPPVPGTPESSKENLILGSALGRVGRAYTLFGPIDAGWSVLGLMRTGGYFPNIALDATGGFRARLGERHTLELFTGLTTSAVQRTKDWAGKDLDLDATAPHTAIALSGRTKKSRIEYGVELATQDNPSTDVNTFSGVLSFPTQRGKRIALRAFVDDEKGAGIEFDRKRSSLGVGFKASKKIDLTLSAYEESIRYGNVRSRDKGLYLTVRVTPGKGRVRTYSAEMILGGGEELILPAPETLAIAESLHDGIGRLDALLAKVSEFMVGIRPAEAVADVISLYNALDPRLRSAIEAETGGIDFTELAPEAFAELIDSASDTLIELRDKMRRLSSILSNPAAVDRIVARLARREIYRGLSEVEIELFGKTIQLTPPQLVAFTYVYGLSLEPLPPLTAREAKDILKKELGSEIMAALGENADHSIAQAANWTANLLRREFNAVLLRAYLAGKRLDRLSVDRGRRPGEINRNGLRASFALLDQRRRKATNEVFDRLIKRTAREIETDRQEALAGAARIGAHRLAAIQKGPAWPKGVTVTVAQEDWPPLLTHYRLVDLLDLIQRGAGKVSESEDARRKNLRIAFGGDSSLGLAIHRGDPTVLTLPPSDGRNSQNLLKAAFAAL